MSKAMFMRKSCQVIQSSLAEFAKSTSVAGIILTKATSRNVQQRPMRGLVLQARQQVANYSTKHSSLLFRQLFDGETYTYTYLLGCTNTRKAIIIDPVNEKVERDLKLSEELQLSLLYGLNTHVHADHVTGTGNLKKKLPEFQSVISKVSGAAADHYVEHGDELTFGEQVIECRRTPGHTNGCMTYVLPEHKMAFTGDTLLVRACGRTDFQEGSADDLFDSVHSQIFSLPDDYLLYPAHDYRGFTVTTVAEEKKLNPRLTLSKEKFVQFMKDLNLAYPKLIDISVPANLKCGEISRQSVLGSETLLNK